LCGIIQSAKNPSETWSVPNQNNCEAEAFGVFIDIHSTSQDAARDVEQKPTMLLVQLHSVENKSKPDIYFAYRQAAEAFEPQRRGDVFLFKATQPPGNVPKYQFPRFVGIVVFDFDAQLGFHMKLRSQTGTVGTSVT
jgi:hypothetical protein